MLVNVINIRNVNKTLNFLAPLRGTGFQINNIKLINFIKNYSFNFKKIYENFKDNKYKIIKDHKCSKMGIYLLFNKINSEFYIGSSINIESRVKII